MLRYLTAGESHGKSLTAILEGLPAGIPVSHEEINLELRRRQGGYGRGDRMKIEKDKVEITSGVRWGKTLGSPVALTVMNKDWENWKKKMSVFPEDEGSGEPVTKPRPGHVDLAGIMKFDHSDIRNVLERSSARETAVRVAVGAICKQFLSHFDIRVFSHVIEIGGIKSPPYKDKDKNKNVSLDDLYCSAEKSEVRCANVKTSLEMIKAIEKAKAEGDSLGGVFQVIVEGIPPGLGSSSHHDRKLDGILAGDLMNIQAIKGVEVGLGFAAAAERGSAVHDEIFYKEETGFYRKTNRAGGIEGGISNGEPIVLQAVMKPIPTLYKPLLSVDINTREPFKASVERSDSCAVPAAGIVGEGAVSFVIAQVFLQKFGGDSLSETRRNYDGYIKRLNERYGG